MNELMVAAREVAERYKQAWLAERAKLERDVASAVSDHTTLPNNYWVAEHRARQLCIGAGLVVEAFGEGIS